MLQISTGNEQAEATSSPVTHEPSHLLWQHQAFAIGSGLKIGEDMSRGPRNSDNPVCTIYKRNNQLVLETHTPGNVEINGSAAQGAQDLNLGDELTVSGETISLIAVAGDG